MKFIQNPHFRSIFAFWMFGLVNNVLYVIILTAAVDLVPSNVPKAVVLVADNFPAFFAKISGPYFIHLIPYGVRMCILSAMSIFAMLAVASLDSVTARLLAVGVASAASGWGEMSFLALTHFFPKSLAGFSSGTGAAGLAGAGAYALLTTTFGLSSRTTIYCSSFLPLIVILCYFVVLPSREGAADYQALDQSDQDEAPEDVDHTERNNLADDSSHPADPAASAMLGSSLEGPKSGLRSHFQRIRKLVYPYMLPLFIVYSAEYVAISGVAPTLLFPVEQSPFKELRDFYPAYNSFYQLGVFISRSSISFYQLKNIYTPSLLQIINLGLLIYQALFYFVPTVWLIFAVYIWTGLLGGAVYVNTFHKIGTDLPYHEREFSLGAVSVADTLGIILASIISMPLEPLICKYQAAHGRDWCKQV